MAGFMTTLQSKGVDPVMMNKFIASVAPMIQQKCGVDIVQTLGLPSASADTTTAPAAAGESAGADTTTAAEAAAPADSNPLAGLSSMAKGFGF
jgi:hypothetical protein